MKELSQERFFFHPEYREKRKRYGAIQSERGVREGRNEKAPYSRDVVIFLTTFLESLRPV
jgi:hypothetical protein